jgi:GTPase SAR1 family protein
METVKEFKKQQTETVEVLKKLLNFLQDGEQYGVEIDPKFKEKLETGIKTTSEDKLKVALIGGFSEGKTSIAAAWAEKYDRATMKINQQESTDDVAVYSMDEFDLIDTPGLFGFKENANKEKYKEITKKKISEAHLILYVMNPNNPIKESHKEELTWLFKDLNLLPRTVFVLSRFDEEADIENEDDYQRKLDIKKENIIGRLKDFGLISNDDISIVAVSANPFDEGIEHWLSNMAEFKKLSHIGSLQNATTAKIKAAGTHAALIEASKKSIVSDILRRELPVAIERDEKTAIECERFSIVCADMEKGLKKNNSNLNEIRIALREYIMDLFTNLILQVNGLSPDTIGEFFERNIGDEGIVLDTKIKNEFERQIGSSYREINRMQVSLDADIQQYNNVIGKMAVGGLKSGGKFLASGGIKVTGEGVKAVRDFIMPAFKFKPWGAIKLAGNISAALPFLGQGIGIAVDLWDIFNQSQKEKEFRNVLDDMVEKFNQQRKAYLEFIDDTNRFMQECFPDYIELKKRLEELHSLMQEKKLQSENFKKWREQGERIAIDADFTIIS